MSYTNQSQAEQVYDMSSLSNQDLPQEFLSPDQFDLVSSFPSSENISESNDFEVFSDTSSIHTQEPDTDRGLLPSGQRRRSKAALAFEIQKEKGKAICRRCKEVLTLNKSTTSNLLNHARAKHKKWFEELSNANSDVPLASTSNQMGLTESFAKVFDQRDFEKKLLDLFMKQDLPFLLINSREFRSLVQYLNPRAKLFQNKTLKNRIMSSYAEKQKEVIKALQDVPGKLSFTMDIWTAPNQISFLGIRVHYIDKTWNLCRTTLDFIPFEDQHSGENIAKLFLSTVQRFKIEDRIAGITVDNASNNDTFLRALREGGFMQSQFHIRCFAHVLNLSVQATLQHFEQPISGLRSFIRKVRVSPSKLQALRVLWEENNDSPSKFSKPILDVSTRWNSTYDMLLRAIKLQKVLVKLLRSNPMEITASERPLLEQDTWVKFESIAKFLQPFKEATEYSCAEKYPTLSTVVPFYNILLEHSLTYMNHSDHFMKEAANEAKDKLLKYYSSAQNTSFIATILDPRLKMEYYERMYKNTPKEHILDTIRNVIKSCYEQLYAPLGGSGFVEEIEEARGSSLISSIFKKRRLDASTELNDYLLTPITSSNETPLEWWKNHEKKYVHLSRMARDYLAIAGTSTSCERLFSSGRQLVTDFRCSLNPSTIQASMCLKDWL
jgi:hypothetical protein